MYFNKLFGLKLLDRAFGQVAGSSVLPWRVYKRPEDFDPRHFPTSERFLLRTDLEGDIRYDAWRHLPRADATVKVKEKMRELRQDWNKVTKLDYIREYLKAFSTDPNSFRYIVHGVRTREDYRIYGRLSSSLSTGKITATLHQWAAMEDWRDSITYAIDIGDRKKITGRLRELGFNEQDAQVVAISISKSGNAIASQAQKDGLLEKSNDWEASFTVAKQEPTSLEFYDFLHKHPFSSDKGGLASS